jgi:hypothetical protein
MTSVRRLSLAAATALTAVLVLGACGSATPGAAATLGDSRITEQALTAQVEEVLEAKGQPITSADSTLVSQTLSRMITMQLVDALAAREGVVVTQGDVDSVVVNYLNQVGGQQQLEDVFIQENVAPSQIESLIRLQLQAQQLGIKLDPTGSAEEQGQAVFDAAALLSEEWDTTVSPRYGTWEDATLSVGPVPNDLSAPPVLG